MTNRIEIARDFSRAPAGRFITDGPASGERFREEFLVPAIRAGDVDVIFDGVAGLPSSFLEEAMGGLIRRGVPLDALERQLNIIANTPRMRSYPDQAWRYIRDAAALIKPVKAG